MFCAPAVTFSSPSESDCGSVKTSGVVGGRQPGESGALEEHRRLGRLRRVRPGRAGRRHQRRLHLLRRPPGWRWRSSAAEPAMCGVAMLVPSKTANGEPANSGSVEERICAPGAETSGFRRCAKSVGPADEKLVITPERPVWISSTSRPIVIFACPPVDAVAVTSRCAVEVGDHRRSGSRARSGSRSDRRLGCRSRSSRSRPPRRRDRPSRRSCSYRARRVRASPSASRRGASP